MAPVGSTCLRIHSSAAIRSNAANYAASLRQPSFPADRIDIRQSLSLSKQEIDDYLAKVAEPKRATLQTLRQAILDILPDADEVISYGMPAFRLNGKVIAGFAAFKNHLAYLPHSGSVLAAVRDELAGYASTEGSLHFPIDKPLPKALVQKLIAARLMEAKPKQSRS